MDFNSSLTKEEKYFISYVKDLIFSADDSLHFTFFLNEREQSLSLDILKHTKHLLYSFFGGYPDAERQILCTGTDDISQIRKRILPIKIIMGKNAVPIRYSSVLGSVLSLGIKRSVIGDICIIDDMSAIVFVLSEMADYLEEHLNRIGKDGCTTKKITFEEIPAIIKKREDLTFVVASDRIDCIIGGLLKKSRNFVADLFSNGKIFVNHQQVFSLSRKVLPGDQLSVRGFGKYKINDAAQTQKGRLRVNAEKFL